MGSRPPTRPCQIVCAEDDEDDRMLLRVAVDQTGREVALQFVDNGEELLRYLRHEAPHRATIGETSCGLVLLDLNMPVKDGRAALAEIKRDPSLRHIPVVVLTTSTRAEDVREIYELGANSFLVKPASFASFVALVEALVRYWFDLSLLPADGPSAATEPPHGSNPGV